MTPSPHHRPRRRAELAGCRLYDVVFDLGRDSPTFLLCASSVTLDTPTRIPMGAGSWQWSAVCPAFYPEGTAIPKPSVMRGRLGRHSSI